MVKFKEGDEVHAVKIGDSYMFSAKLWEEMKPSLAVTDENIGDILGIDVHVSSALPYIYHENMEDE